jgi:predicted enzyme related to lactoylglutathione lyase
LARESGGGEIEPGGATILMPQKDVQDVGRIAILTDPTGAVFGLLKPQA